MFNWLLNKISPSISRLPSELFDGDNYDRTRDYTQSEPVATLTWDMPNVIRHEGILYISGLCLVTTKKNKNSLKTTSMEIMEKDFHTDYPPFLDEFFESSDNIEPLTSRLELNEGNVQSFATDFNRDGQIVTFFMANPN